MRILHLLASPSFSGPAENVALLALAQRELGHEVRVAVDSVRTDVAAEEPAAPRFASLGLLDESGLGLTVKGSPAAFVRDVRLLGRQRLDVVHAHFTHDHLVARLGRPRGARLVRSIHAPRSLRWSLPAADAYTVPSADLLRRLLGKRVGVLPPLVGPAFVPAADRSAIRNRLEIAGNPIIGMVSTFQPSRRHALGLEAFARLRIAKPDARLVLVGDGRLESAIRGDVNARGLGSAVTFTGYRSGADFIAWLQALDVVWILGLGNDWSGRAAAQARACGVRVVTVDEGGLAQHADAVVEAEAGAIVAASEGAPSSGRGTSNEAIARAVCRLYER